jgi:hypothetical protein
LIEVAEGVNCHVDWLRPAEITKDKVRQLLADVPEIENVVRCNGFQMDIVVKPQLAEMRVEVTEFLGRYQRSGSELDAGIDACEWLQAQLDSWVDEFNA